MEGFGGSTPNLGDPPVLVSSNVQPAKKSKSGIVFGNNVSYKNVIKVSDLVVHDPLGDVVGAGHSPLHEAHRPGAGLGQGYPG